MTSVMRRTVIALLILACALPVIASAQSSSDELRNTIRAAVLSDPRAASLQPIEIEAMVTALARQAESAGITAADIVWRPTEDGSIGGAPTSCDGFPCALNRAFGFDGSDYTIPIMLGASALMLIFIIASILEYRHLHLKRIHASGAGQPPVGQ